MKKFAMAAIMFASATLLHARDMSPWLGNVYECESSLSYANTHARHIHKSSRLTTAAFSATLDPQLDAKFSLSAATPGRHLVEFRQAKLRVRHLLMNDIMGDPLSLIAGVCLEAASHSQCKDRLQMQISQAVLAAHVAAGKEFLMAKNRHMHLWAVGQVKVGRAAAPALSGALHADWVVGEEKDQTHRFGVVGIYTHGCGAREFRREGHGALYSRVAFRALDAGVRYSYSYFSLGSIAFEYTKRLVAKQCPKHAIQAKLTVTLPFSI